MIQENDRLEELLALRERLDKCVLEGGDLDGLTEILARSLKCTAVFEDSSFALKAAGFCGTEQPEQLTTYLSLKTCPSMKQALKAGPLPKQARFITDRYDNWTVHRLVYPVFAGPEQLGFLSLLNVEPPFNESDVLPLKHAANAFAILLSHNKKIAEIELRLKGNFVEDLIKAEPSDFESIMNRAGALSYDITQPHRVLVAEIDNLKQLAAHLSGEQVARFKTELVTKIQYIIDQKAHGMASFHGEELILLLQQKDSSINLSKQLAEELAEEIPRQFKARLYIGIGNSCAALSDFKDSYLTAKKALDIGEFMITEGNVRSFEQFKVHALFLSTLKPEEMFGYAKSQLKPLLDYDEAHKTELIKTLQEFLYLRNNIEGTAKSLSMSVSGLKYRLQKIEQIIGRVLKDNKVCFDLQLALIILQLFGEYKIKD